MGWEFWVVLGAGVVVGFLGAMLGIGGGVLIVPFLVTQGIPIEGAITASLVSVIATSCAASASYLAGGLANLRLGMTLGVTTAVGGVVGGVIGVSVGRELLTLLFAAALLAVAAILWGRRPVDAGPVPESADLGELGGRFYDPRVGREVRYRVHRLRRGLGLGLLAGVASGLLGIGGGVVNVPSMVLIMGVPTKVAAATSAFMLGFTAVASVLIYYLAGFLNVEVTAAIALGVLIGSSISARAVPQLRGRLINRILALVLATIALVMVLRSIGIV